MSVGKKILIIILSVIICTCIGLDIWALIIHLVYPTKVVAKTYEVGLQETADGDTRYFVEINYYSNDNSNGLEMFEIKFNYMLDEDKQAFYSQGLQFVSDTKDSNINWKFFKEKADKDSDPYRVENGFSGDKYFANFSSYGLENGASIYNYASHDNYETTILSSNPINDETMFKIELGTSEEKEIYGMKFKLRDYSDNLNKYPLIIENEISGPYFFSGSFFWDKHENYYSYYDVYYFSQLLYNSIQPLKNGTSQSVIFEFGDMFNYGKYNEETGIYEFEKGSVENDKIINLIKSYYSIKVNINADGAQNAQYDSLFKMIHGKANYNTTGDYSGDDYFIGRTVINCGINAFDVIVAENKESFKLKLTENFVNYYSNFKETIVLKVVVNFAELEERYVKFAGFEENAFADFVVYDYGTANSGVITC